LTLHYGPYRPPKIRVGHRLFCQIRGTVKVWRFSDGPIPWPLTQVRGSGGIGGGKAFIVCSDLVRAVRSESALAVQHWWGVGPVTVGKWRRQLGVKAFNDGTLKLWRHWQPKKLPAGAPGPLIAIAPAKLRAARLRAGLTLLQVAKRCCWSGTNSYQQ